MKKEKKFDAVEMMRNIRVNLSERYKKDPSQEREDLLLINKKYNLQSKSSSPRKKTA